MNAYISEIQLIYMGITVEMAAADARLNWPPPTILAYPILLQPPISERIIIPRTNQLVFSLRNRYQSR